jgi:integral membrane protein
MSAPDFRDPVGRVRAVGMVEGVSFLLLMGVAMPLKYLADMPLAVTYVGWAHGVLFIAFLFVLFLAWAGGALSFGKSLLAFAASLLPFGPFLIDRKLAKSAPGGDPVD